MSELIEKEVYCTIEKYVDELKLTDCVIDVKPETAAGDNYLGVISRVNVCGIDRIGNKKQLHFIVKSSQKSEEFRKTVNVRDVYEREIFVYTNVFPVFEKFQKDKCNKNQFKSYAKLYKYTLEDTCESLVMENMKILGYQLRNRLEPVDYHHTSLVMKEYGRLHALSFALKDQKPKIFQKLVDQCQNSFFHNMQADFKEMFEPYHEHALKVLDPQTDAHLLKKFKLSSDEYLDLLLKVLSYEEVGNYAVIVHGDCWINNILFNYNNPEEPNVPTDICILDWQLSCAGSPALDLSYFLFTNTDKKLRDQYFDTFLEQYYDSFSFFLNELGSDANELFPREVFQKHMKQFSIYGLIMSLMVIRLMLTPKDEAIDFSKMTQEERVKAARGEIKNAEVYEERIRGLLEDFYRLDYF